VRARAARPGCRLTGDADCEASTGSELAGSKKCGIRSAWPLRGRDPVAAASQIAALELPMQARVEILTIGTEILAGSVLDTNSHWLCHQLALRGLVTQRITTLADDPAVISEELRAAIARQPELILCSGGLGPTADDLTLASVAEGLGLRLEQNAPALEMVTDFYRNLRAASGPGEAVITPERAKMAVLPAGSLPLDNPAGAAPGVLIFMAGISIACLPGVPAELRAIFSESLWPRISHLAQNTHYLARTVITDCYDESLMASAVDSLAAAFPDLYVKSRAHAYGTGIADFVTLSARGADLALLETRLDAAQDQLRESLTKIGVAVCEVRAGTGPEPPTS
jgi:molybdenum cofactor synthesis domain-containing protein